ncbi:hypothetical protein OEZ85_011508 [Tetradesmus obliquus]|uniref:SMP-30/Gluconolactonase/LRE-like region domain-containing protein n=1 Tax=Tetradesmus obliquus TaxID=3088 RepID=A0ABY8TQX3_TETOB|nr:hypothetical protein OEZ85_011508 [Tetradesmus obliquus]
MGLLVVIVALALCAAGAQAALPNGICSYSSLAVLGPGSMRAANNFSPLSQFKGCGYAVADNAFLGLVDTSAAPRVAAEASYAFAHEAPVYLPALKQIFFVSNRLGNTSGVTQFIELNTLDISTGTVTKLPESLGNSLAMSNGATNLPGTDDSIALLTQGKGDWQPGAVNKLNLKTLKHEVLLDNYLGRQFNSPNDIAFFKDGRTLFFTDPPYGFAQNFKLQPQLGNYVYAYDTVSKIVSVAADGFVKPNGVAFSPDYKTAYVTDTGMADGTGPSGFNPANPQTIYAFDMETAKSGKSGSFFPTLRNRRTFAVAETGLPDGIKLDVQGNVYTGTGAGVEVFAPSGKRLGTVLIEGGVANLVFADKVLYALNEKRIIAVQMRVPGAKLP